MCGNKASAKGMTLIMKMRE